MSHRSNYYTLPVPSVYHYPDSSTRRFGSPGSDIDIFGRAVCRCSIQKQMHFIRKVISVTALQVLLAAGIAATLTHTEPFVEWLQESHRSKYSWWMPLLPMFIITCLVGWHLWMQYFCLTRIYRAGLFSIFSVLMAWIISAIVSKLCYNQGILILLMTVLGLAGALLYTLQTQVAFSGIGPIATSGIAMYMSLPWVRCMFDVDTISIMWAMVTSFVICGYTILELYFIMGYLTLDDYILANMCFYVDLLYPMRCLHNICELTDHIEIFPKILDPGPHR
ncbi:hypothetical protein BX666DRAFT_1891455 [Dichotomocladium elegans]|nr:hypothetical protein BX666DRAFT_1891455 [Dichotomocladium elegans]